MRWRRGRAAIAVAFLFALGGALGGRPSPVEAADTETIVILHTNDEHATIENFGRIAWQRAQLQEEYDHVFLVSAGDIFSGNPVVDQYIVHGEDLRGEPIVDLMGMAGYDVVVIGNHEFDYGQEILQQGIDQARFPFILANVYAEAAHLKQPPAYVTLETEAGTVVTFLGLTEVTPAGIPSTHPGKLEGLEFLDPITTASQYLYLRETADLFVALTHLGYEWDQELAATMGELDIIIGGHSHTTITSPQLHNGVLVAQAGENAEYLGKIIVEITAQGDIVSMEGFLIPVGDIAGTAEEVEQRIAYYQEQAEAVFARQLNHLLQPLAGNAELGSLMADTIVEVLGVDFAFANHGGVRVDSLSDVLTVGDVFRLEPFGNDIVVLPMTPDDIRSLLAFSYLRHNQVDLQPGGLHYTITVGPDGEIEDVELAHPDDTPLQEDSVYEVGLSSYVASTYEFSSQGEGFNTYRRHNDLIVEYVEGLSSEELATYSGTSRVRVVSLSDDTVIVRCISWEEAAQYVNETLWVYGPVAGVFRTAYDRVFINIPTDYPDQEFVIMLHEDHISSFDEEYGRGFENQLVGETACVYGRLTLYRGVPQILPNNPEHLRSASLNAECPEVCSP